MIDRSDIPLGWSMIRLGDFATKITKGSTPTSYGHQYQSSGIPFIRIENLRDGSIDRASVRAFIDDAANETLKRSKLEAGDLLLSIAGTIGKSAIVSEADVPANTNQALAIIRGTGKVVEPDFLRFTLASNDTQNQTKRDQRGGALQNISLDDVKNLTISLPPLNEQRRIVAKIEDLSARSRAAKEALDAIPPLLERFRQSVLAAAFRGDLTKQWREQNPNVEPASVLLDRIRQERRHRWEQDYLAQQKAKGKTPKDDKWKEKYQEPEPVDTTGLPELPEGWCWAAGRELFTWSSGKNLPQKKQKPGPYPVYGGNGVSGLHDEYLISNSTLVIGRVGAHCGNVYWTDSKSWITDNAIYATTIVKSVNLKFSVYLFRAAELNKKAGGSGQPFVNQPLLNELLIALPPAAEQNAIVETLEEAESVSADQTRCADGVRAQMARLNQSILAKAFRGELVPQDPNDEPASALLERIHAER